MNDILNFRWRQANQGFKIVARPRLCKFKLASLQATTRDSVRLNKHFEFIFAWPQVPTCIGDSVVVVVVVVVVSCHHPFLLGRYAVSCIFDTREKQQTCPRVTPLLSIGCDS